MPIPPSTKRVGFHCATFAQEHFSDHLWCRCQEFEAWDNLAASSAIAASSVIQSIQKGALPESAPVTSPQWVLGPLAISYRSREFVKAFPPPRHGPSPAGCCLLELLPRSASDWKPSSHRLLAPARGSASHLRLDTCLANLLVEPTIANYYAAPVSSVRCRPCSLLLLQGPPMLHPSSETPALPQTVGCSAWTL